MPTEFATNDADITLRALSPDADAPLLHRWFTMDYARFWGMQDHSEAQTLAVYRTMVDSGHATAWMGLFRGQRAFIVECYEPRHDELARHYAVQPGDMGMHFFVGPPQGPRIPDFTRRVFRALMGFMFERLDASRIVVEPDVRNDKVQVLNREMGFVHQREIELPHKRAALAFCTRRDFERATSHTPRKESNE
jgi:RimJ/RimL family protein N-acetyltransferase